MTEEKIQIELEYLFNKLNSLEERILNMDALNTSSINSIENALNNIDDDDLWTIKRGILSLCKNSNILLSKVHKDSSVVTGMHTGDNKLQITKTDIDLYYKHIDSYETELEVLSKKTMKLRTASRDIIKKNLNMTLVLDTVEKRNKCIKLLKRASKHKTIEYKELMIKLNSDIQDIIDIRKELGEFPEGSELYNNYYVLMDARINLQEHSDRWNILKNTHLKGLDRAPDSKIVTAFTITRDFVDETELYFNEMLAELNRIKYNLDKALADIEKDKEDIEIDCDDDLLDI